MLERIDPFISPFPKIKRNPQSYKVQGLGLTESWMIFICLTIVDFPDSPAPWRRKENISDKKNYSGERRKSLFLASSFFEPALINAIN